LKYNIRFRVIMLKNCSLLCIAVAPGRVTNGDEERNAGKRASFSKTLPDNDLGEVEPGAYAAWLAVLASGTRRNSSACRGPRVRRSN
jgi:hypothetical protein